MPGRPCTPEAGAANDPASADVDGHGHRFRLGVDQPDYARLLRCFASFAGAALHASVTRRAASYGFDTQSVSIRPGGRRTAPIPGSFGGGDRPQRTGSKAAGEAGAARSLGKGPGRRRRGGGNRKACPTAPA